MWNGLGHSASLVGEGLSTDRNERAMSHNSVLMQRGPRGWSAGVAENTATTLARADDTDSTLRRRKVD